MVSRKPRLRSTRPIGESHSKPGKPQWLQFNLISIAPLSPKHQHSPLIHPKLQNREQNAPDTTNHACRPPSGKSPGPIPECCCSFVCGSPFSMSTSARSCAVSGIIFASVFDISELEVRREGERWMFVVVLFSMPVASSELLELAMMVWKWFGGQASLYQKRRPLM